ncbi:hypothetical protein WA158_005938 [Blastocystis sp. Blastoise]
MNTQIPNQYNYIPSVSPTQPMNTQSQLSSNNNNDDTFNPYAQPSTQSQAIGNISVVNAYGDDSSNQHINSIPSYYPNQPQNSMESKPMTLDAIQSQPISPAPTPATQYTTSAPVIPSGPISITTPKLNQNQQNYNIQPNQQYNNNNQQNQLYNSNPQQNQQYNSQINYPNNNNNNNNNMYSTQPMQQQPIQMICPTCQQRINAPPNAPIFRCPCGQILQAPSPSPSPYYPQQQQQQQPMYSNQPVDANNYYLSTQYTNPATTNTNSIYTTNGTTTSSTSTYNSNNTKKDNKKKSDISTGAATAGLAIAGGLLLGGLLSLGGGRH